MSVLVIYAHPAPRRSRVNELLREQVRDLVPVRDLYSLYPDFDIDVAAEQSALLGVAHIVLQFPLQWYSVPPLLKAWFDEVLLYGWAYGEGGSALQDKTLTVVTSAGAPPSAYAPDGVNRYPLTAYLLPLEQTAVLCGMRWQPPLVLHAADHANQQEILQYAQQYQQLLNRLRAGA